MIPPLTIHESRGYKLAAQVNIDPRRLREKRKTKLLLPVFWILPLSFHLYIYSLYLFVYINFSIQSIHCNLFIYILLFSLFIYYNLFIYTDSFSFFIYSYLFIYIYHFIRSIYALQFIYLYWFFFVCLFTACICSSIKQFISSFLSQHS